MALRRTDRLLKTYGLQPTGTAGSKLKKFNRQTSNIRIKSRTFKKMLNTLFLHAASFHEQQRKAEVKHKVIQQRFFDQILSADLAIQNLPRFKNRPVKIY